MQDSEILQGLRQNDPSALHAAVFGYGAYVSTVLRNTGGGRLAVADVEELASDTFFVLWQNAARIRGQNLRAWLARTARNACIDFLRRQKENLPLEEATALDAASDPAHLAIRNMEADALLALLALLPNAEQEVLRRHYYQDQKVAQIALTLGITESAVKQRLSRGRARLRKELLKQNIYHAH